MIEHFGMAFNSANAYSIAIKRISRHYSEQSGQATNLYAKTRSAVVREIARKYSQAGIYSDFGNYGNGTNRAAINRYVDYVEARERADNRNSNGQTPQLFQEPQEENLADYSANITYEKDLKVALCHQISELFPEHRIFGPGRQGVEYAIKGKKIDILLENIKEGGLLAIELKSAAANYDVFGQISMYLGLLKTEFPERDARGIIICGEVNEGLRAACLTNPNISLKTYKMSLHLRDP